MNIVKHEFWSTPVWEVETGFDSYFNTVLVNDIAELARTGLQYNIWKSNKHSIKQLKEKTFECLDATVRDCFPEFNPYDPVLIDGWANRTRPGESLALHSHPHATLITTYYAKSPEKSGDLLLVDPRGAINWDWHVDTFPKLLHGVNYKRIKPTEGKMVFFPAYIMHMVEANRSNEDRICVASNIQNGISTINFTTRSTND